MTFQGLINLIRTVAWELLHPLTGALTRLTQRVDALAGAPVGNSAALGAGPAPASEPAPAWSTFQANARIALGLGYVDQVGAITNIDATARFFFAARGGERFQSAVLSSRAPTPDGYTSRVRVLVAYYHLETPPVVLADLTLQGGDSRVSVGNDADWTFSDGEVVLVEVLQNAGLLDISVEVACPVESSEP